MAIWHRSSVDSAEGVRWEASHLHNAFLDVLYNNGLVGLVLILSMHAIIIKTCCALSGTLAHHVSFMRLLSGF